VTRPRAADDFEAIYERIKELRGETAAARSAEADQPTRAATPITDHERRLKDRREGLPPPWVPTIFLKRPTNSEIARRFWHTRCGW
jgi:plasmid stabilization system protein ParE